MRKIGKYMDRHPLIAIALGYLVLIAITLVVVPDNDAQVQAVLHQRGVT